MTGAYPTKSLPRLSPRFACALTLASLMLSVSAACAEETSSSASHPPASKNVAQETPNIQQRQLTDTGGWGLVYISSFGMDVCGDSLLGKRYREAIIAKVDSCPFTPEAKATFYKDSALVTNQILSDFTAYFLSHPLTKYVPDEDKHCEKFSELEKLLREKLAEYDTKAISLADVIVDRSGKALDCKTTSEESLQQPLKSTTPNTFNNSTH